MENRIAIFQRKEIRKTFHDGDWWFVITDVVAALTDTPVPSDYLKKIRKRDPQLADAFKGGGTTCPPPFPAIRNRRRFTETAVLEHDGDFSPRPIHTEPQG